MAMVMTFLPFLFSVPVVTLFALFFMVMVVMMMMMAMVVFVTMNIKAMIFMTSYIAFITLIAHISFCLFMLMMTAFYILFMMTLLGAQVMSSVDGFVTFFFTVVIIFAYSVPPFSVSTRFMISVTTIALFLAFVTASGFGSFPFVGIVVTAACEKATRTLNAFIAIIQAIATATAVITSTVRETVRVCSGTAGVIAVYQVIYLRTTILSIMTPNLERFLAFCLRRDVW